MAANPNTWQDDDAILARGLFGTTDRERITSLVCQWVSERLGDPVRLIEIEMSIGAAITLDRLDGSKVFVKVLGDAVDLAALEAQTNVQRALAQAGFPAPCVLNGPSPLGAGYAVLMSYDHSGQPTDCRIPGVRDRMAAGLARLIRETASLAGIRPPRKPLPSSSAIWPKPHSALFDQAIEEGEIDASPDLVGKLAALRDGGHAEDLVLSKEDRQSLVKTPAKPSLIPSDVDAILAQNGIHLPNKHPDRQQLALAILRAEVNAYRTVEARRRGDAIETPERPPLIKVPEAPVQGATLSEVRAIWINEVKPGKKAQDDNALYVRRFIDMFGNIPIALITRK